MPQPLLSRRSHRSRPEVPFLDGMSLALARVHEGCGPSRRMLALMIARAFEGPVFWLRLAWTAEHLNPAGLPDGVNPGRITTVDARRPEDILWTMEEVLRSGAVPLCVADLPAAPSLTAVRRMHLAAETGTAEGTVAPLGLLLTPGAGGAAGVESRWHLAPDHAPGTSRWRLTRTRARTAPVQSWQVALQGSRLIPGPVDAEPAARVA